jgi:hypothetical protein
MGGVVSDVVSGVGDLGQGIISGVDNALTSLDDAIPQEAKIAAAIYAASQGLPIGAEGAALSGANAAVAADNAYLASQALTPAQAAAAAASSVEASQLTGLTGSTTTPSIYDQVISQLNQYPTTLPPATTPTAIPSAVTTAGEMTAQQTLEKIAQEQAGSAGLLGSALNFAKDNIPLTLAGAGLAAKALGGSTPTSSTTTSTIDPEVKAAYLRNLEEARMVGAGLGQRQFAPYADYNLGMVQKYMNPYENQVVQNTLADIERARQGQISAEGARATAAGAFGGTRQAVTRSLVDEAALRNAGNLAAQLRQSGFAQAQNLGLSQQQMMQQYEQQKLDAVRGLPLERLNIAQGALSLQPARVGESTTKPIYTNPVASGFGGALGGAQLGSLIGGKANPEYAGYGAGIGGLLGFLG